MIVHGGVTNARSFGHLVIPSFSRRSESRTGGSNTSRRSKSAAFFYVKKICSICSRSFFPCIYSTSVRESGIRDSKGDALQHKARRELSLVFLFGRGDMKSGSASAPTGGGGGGGGLAITERQKPAPSCVAALFQMFAKRKLFSSSSKKSKLLPPVRAHKFSPGRPLVGGEKTAVAKMKPLLLDSADYSRSKIECNGTSRYPQPVQDRNCIENEMCAPGVVARLMGLSSMPANQSHQRPNKATDSSEPGDHWNSGRQDCSGMSRSIHTSPQKQQKTGQHIDDRRHDNAGQFNALDTRPLWPRRHAHKVASSPVKSPRSMSSRNKARLIEAAVKVLEPGLQSRNRRLSWRHSYLEYPCSSDDGVPHASAVLHNVSDQFLRDMCDVDIPRLGAHNTGATSLDNSTSDQRTEEDSSKKIIPSRRSDQNRSCQLQPEYFLFSSNEKAGFGDNVQNISNCTAVANQDAPRKQLKSNISRDNAPHGPLKQNNLKQNALPAACGAADPGYVMQSKKHRSGERNMRNKAQDFISLNKRMNGSASLRSKRKVEDRLGESHTSAGNKNMSTKGCRASNLNGGTSNKLKLKTGTPKTMEKDMIIAKGAGLVSEKPKLASTNCARSDFQRQPVSHNVSRANKKSCNISFTSSSPMKVAPILHGDNASGPAVQRSPVDTFPKRRSHRDCQNTSAQREIVFWEDLQGTSNLQSTESVFYNHDEVKNRVILGCRAQAVSSSFENKSGGHVTEESLSNELLKQHNSVDSEIYYDKKDRYKVAHLRETHKKHVAGAKGSKQTPSISRSSNKGSPTSIIQSRNADNACIPGIPRNTAEGTSTNSHRRETCTAAASIVQDITTQRKPRCGDPNFGQHDLQPSEPDEIQDSKLLHPGEVTVTTTVELLLTNVRASTRHNKSEESHKAFLLRTTECALAALTTTGSSSKRQEDSINTAIIKDDKEASTLRNLALDLVWDCMDSMCSQLCNSGYSSFSELLALICTEERLADRVGKEIARCCAMAGRSLDELAVGEVEREVEVGMDSMIEAVQIGVQIEHDLVQELVDEIGVDVFKRW